MKDPKYKIGQTLYMEHSGGDVIREFGQVAEILIEKTINKTGNKTKIYYKKADDDEFTKEEVLFATIKEVKGEMITKLRKEFDEKVAALGV